MVQTIREEIASLLSHCQVSSCANTSLLSLKAPNLIQGEATLPAEQVLATLCWP